MPEIDPKVGKGINFVENLKRGSVLGESEGNTSNILVRIVNSCTAKPLSTFCVIKNQILKKNKTVLSFFSVDGHFVSTKQ